MMSRKYYLLILFAGIAISAFPQPSVKADEVLKADTASVNLLLQQSTESILEDQDKSISLANRAKDVSERINYLPGQALALKNVALALYYKGDYREAIKTFQESLNLYEQLKDETGVANILNNMGAIFGEQGNDTKGLEYGLRSLAISEKLGNKLRIVSALNTVGSIYFNQPDKKDTALGYFLRGLPLCEEIGNNKALGTFSANIGEIYWDKKDYKKAISYYEKAIKPLELVNDPNSSFAYNGIGKIYREQGNFEQALAYHNKALQIADELGSKPNMVKSLAGIANVYAAQKNYQDAIRYFNQAILIAEDIKAAQDLKDIYQDMANVYSKIPDYKNAFKYKELYANIKDTLYNITSTKKLGALQFEFDLEKKQNEINLLTKDKAIGEQKLQKQRLFKNAFMIGLFLTFTIALLIYRNYRQNVKTHRIVSRQKNEIENLLLNILPKKVAAELQTTGHATPRHFDSVSVMFTDFKGFTIIADKMSPDDLVQELDACFIAFDEIIARNHLEKIKTIGDSYMCAGNIPAPDENHVFNIVKAGLEIQQFVSNYNQQRKEKGLSPWLIRIGIHVGPLVAGVVGKRKYAYDIWGSTVNIASRMESSGEAGKVNISSAVYEIIKDRYRCKYRGKINAKNVGEIDMYFIEEELSLPETVLVEEAQVVKQ